MSSKMIIIEGNSNDKDDVRAFMVKGEAGATIEKIEKTSTSGSVDTYTIYIDDGRTQTFTVTNGKTINSIEKTSTSGLVDTYTITFNDGDTQTFTVTNGKDGETYEVPTGSIIGYDGNTVPAGYEEVDNPYTTYSTTEQIIGKWIDGKPIYRKVIDYYPTETIGASDTTTNIDIPHNISNFGQLTNNVSCVDEGNHSFPLFGSTTGTSLTSGTCIIQVDTTNIKFRIVNDTWGSRHFYFILEYTKTTD